MTINLARHLFVKTFLQHVDVHLLDLSQYDLFGPVAPRSLNFEIEFHVRCIVTMDRTNGDSFVAKTAGIHFQMTAPNRKYHANQILTDRAQVGELAQAVQAVVEEPVQLAFVDQGYTGEEPMAAAAQAGIQLHVIKHHEAKRGFVLLPRRWAVERSFAWTARFRRLARDYERLPATLAGYHWLAFVTLMLATLFNRS